MRTGQTLIPTDGFTNGRATSANTLREWRTPNSRQSRIPLRSYNKDGEYNLLAELLADKNNIPFIFLRFSGVDKAAISERNDYGYGCILSVYEKIKAIRI